MHHFLAVLVFCINLTERECVCVVKLVVLVPHVNSAFEH